MGRSARNADSVNRLDAQEFNSLVDLATVEFVDGQKYENFGFYPDTEVGGGVWKAVSGLDKSTNNGGTVVTVEALVAWRDAAVADGGVTTANLQANLNVLFTAGTGTGDGFVREGTNRNIDSVADASWFGATADFVSNKGTDNSPCFRQAAAVSKVVTAAVGAYGFSSKVTFGNNSLIIPSQIGFTAYANDGFTGDYIFEWYKTGGLVTGITVKNARTDSRGLAGGMVFYRLYDSCILDNLGAFNAKSDKHSIAILGRDTTDGAPSDIGQTVIASNLIGNHFDGTATVASLKIDRLQEFQLNNFKFWAGNGGTKSNCPAIEIEDSRSGTIITPSAASSSDFGIRIKSTNRTSRNIILLNPLYENTDNQLDVLGTATHKLFQVQQINPRYENPTAGITRVDHSSGGTIDVTTRAITVGAGCINLEVICDEQSQVTNSGSNTTVKSRANAVTALPAFYPGLISIADAGPRYELKVKGRTDKWLLNWNASSSGNFGFRLGYDNGTTFGQAYSISASGNQHKWYDAGTGATLLQTNAPSSGGSSLYVVHNDGATSTLKQVFVGAVDSAGAGFRQLRVAN